jgi:hypothetical protein
VLKLTLVTLSLACATLPGCKSLPTGTPAPVKPTEAPGGGTYVRLDELRSRYPYYTWAKAPENQKLAEEFQLVRQTDAWKAFVRALRTCDDAVIVLLEQGITEWVAPGLTIAPVNRTRNAWRSASTYGIRPPKLTEGLTSFDEEGLGFRLWVIDETAAVLMARSLRGQVIGIFDLRLDPTGRQNVVSHMLERAFRYPDLYLSYPFNVVMATDTIVVPDVTVIIDRVKGEAHIFNSVAGEVEVKK